MCPKPVQKSSKSKLNDLLNQIDNLEDKSTNRLSFLRKFGYMLHFWSYYLLLLVF
jgi:hypothetical protein